MTQVSGWGRFPVIEAEGRYFDTEAQLAEMLQGDGPLIAHGMGRSYGDSALAPRLALTRRFNAALDFDPATGLLTCQAGLTLAEIESAFVPRGWFPEVTPGTKLVTVGGAIASDVHGKNHHAAGCFSQAVDWLDLMLPGGDVLRCSAGENAELFRATCGGMGLTGIILRAAIRLRPIKSAYLAERRYRAANLAEIIDLFEAHGGAPYSVAWLDCLAKGDSLGRSILMVGDFLADGRLDRPKDGGPPVPVDMPSFTLNRFSVAAFNEAVYRFTGRPGRHRVHLDKFFYPLDAIQNWNRMYGRAGVVQYQFVVPKAAGRAGLTAVLGEVARRGLGSFLVVLKLMGPVNHNPLSFPLEGYTLALDFKVQPDLEPVLRRLDKIVLDHGGRIYLTKDARLPREDFRAGYPAWEEFLALREKMGLKGRLESLQAQRLGI